METYFTIKLWAQVYIPLIILGVIIGLYLIICLLAKISEIGEKIMNRNSDKKDCENDD